VCDLLIYPVIRGYRALRVVCDLLTYPVIRDYRALRLVCDLLTYPVIRNYRAFWVVCEVLTYPVIDCGDLWHRQRITLYGVVSIVIGGCVWIDCDW
jgi:hypothetical protein